MLYDDAFELFRAVAVPANRRRLLRTLLVGAGWLLATAASAGEPEAFWRAVKALSFDDLAVREAQGDKREYALALQRMIEGDEAGEDALRRLCEAGDPQVRGESRRVYAGLLAAGSRWAELENRQRETEPDLPREVITEFGKLPPASLTFPDGPVTLPAKRGRLTGTPMIPVTVNGHRRWFWVDTGASLTLLASDVAKATGVAPLGAATTRAGTATTRMVGARPTVIHDLALGGIRFRNHPAMILRAEDMRARLFGIFTLLKIDGILGWNALSQLDLEIDYSQPRVVLRRPVHNGTASRNLFWLGEPLVRGRGPDGVGFVFSLDTGGRRSFAMPEFLRKTKARVEGERTQRVGGAGGSERLPVRRIAPVEARVSDCAVRLSEVREEWRPERLVLLDGFVGVDLAGRGWMRIDATNGRFECRPRPPAGGADAAPTGR
jgi:hypothetical protein